MLTRRKRIFSSDESTPYEAKVKAQQLAFAPIAFQAARVLCSTGILEFIHRSRKDGVTLGDVQKKVKLSLYGVKVLIEAGLGAGLIVTQDKKFFTTKTAHMLLFDPMTKVNMEFTHDICYQGMFDLEEAIKSRQPSGLKKLGKWETIYEGLSALKPKVKKSWFDFDHYYSNSVFPLVLPQVFKDKPKKIMDVGGNTGNWAMLCASYDPEVSVTLVDLPGQLRVAQKRIKSKGLEKRIHFHPVNLLDATVAFPKGYDVIWMSQFLDCFSKAEIISILKRARRAMGKHTSLYILETYWDRQENETAAYCLQQTSLYFTCIANGNSQFYHSDDMKECIEKAGLKLVEDHDRIGNFHTLMRCTKS